MDSHLGHGKPFLTPRAGCKNVTSGRLLHGLDSPSHWVLGRLPRRGGGVNVCCSPLPRHVPEENNGWFLSSKGRTKQRAGGLQAWVLSRRHKPGVPCPPLSVSATPEGLAGLQEGHRLRPKLWLPDVTFYPQSASLRLNTVVLKFLSEDASAPGRADSENVCLTECLRNQRRGVSQPESQGAGVSCSPFSRSLKVRIG